MTVLVTGGAGYIGCHVVHLLTGRGQDVVVVDDMSNGVAARIPGVPLVAASVLDGATLERTISEYGVDAVIHFAARKQVGESVERPEYYYTENLGGMAALLAAMRARGVDRFVYSSSAAVYGMPDVDLVAEDDPCRPINPYGETKLAGEWLMRDAARAWDLRATALRYFNVAGAGRPELADTAVLNLIPIALHAIGEGTAPRVYGDDYDTPDGTCIRDYIHVQDLADAHLAALDDLDRTGRACDAYNVGTGRGASVTEVLDAVLAETGSDLQPVVAARRPGDPATLGSRRLANRVRAGVGARHDLSDIVRSAVEGWRLQRGSGDR